MIDLASVKVTTPKFSVCIPASRNTPWFMSALKSVLGQSVSSLEVIVSDDSGGSLREAVDTVADGRVKYHANAKSLGFAGNHCRAIELASGDYVAFIHDDDVWKPGYLDSAACILDEHLDCGLVISSAYEIDSADNILGLRPNRLVQGAVVNPLAEFLQSDFMMMLPSVTVFRRVALNANRRPWPDVIAADVTMYIDLVVAGWTVHYSAAPQVLYRTHPNQIGSDDLAHRHAIVTIWSMYHFSDSQVESRRVERLSNALIARAGSFLRRSRQREALNDLATAKSLMSSRIHWRWLALRVLAAYPRAFRSIEKIRARLTDSAARRHKGVG